MVPEDPRTRTKFSEFLGPRAESRTCESQQNTTTTTIRTHSCITAEVSPDCTLFNVKSSPLIRDTLHHDNQLFGTRSRQFCHLQTKTLLQTSAADQENCLKKYTGMRNLRKINTLNISITQFGLITYPKFYERQQKAHLKLYEENK